MKEQYSFELISSLHIVSYPIYSSLDSQAIVQLELEEIKSRYSRHSEETKYRWVAKIVSYSGDTRSSHNRSDCFPIARIYGPWMFGSASGRKYEYVSKACCIRAQSCDCQLWRADDALGTSIPHRIEIDRSVSLGLDSLFARSREPFWLGSLVILDE